MLDEKQNFKLADYFVTVGIDDFNTREQMMKIPNDETKTNSIKASV